MKRLGMIFIGGALCAALVAGYVRANRYTAGEKALVEALAEKDTPALIKAAVARMSDELEKDVERFPELIREMERYTRERADSASAALLHSLTAEMYDRYYQANRWTIDQRTALRDYVPDDIREWSGNLFTDKIREELRASLRPADTLRATPAATFASLLKAGNAEGLRPTLLDFLAYRAIEILPDAEWYEALLACHRADGNRSALLMAELAYLEYLRSHDGSLADDRYAEKLDSLSVVYATDPYAIEIAKQQWYLKEQAQYQLPSEEAREAARGELYAYAKAMIARFQDSPRVAFFENQLGYLEQPLLSVGSDRNVYPGQALRLNVSYRNVAELTVRVYENPAPPAAASREDQRRKRGREVKSVTHTLRMPDTYTQRDTTLEIPMEAPGLYLCEVADAARRVEATVAFSVSRLAASTHRLATGETEVLVTDYWTGRPARDAVVVGYNHSMQWIPQALDTVRTDANGLARFAGKYRKSLETVRPLVPGDTSSLVANVPGYYPQAEAQEAVAISLFTDRTLYRPGQTVSFKGIAYVRDVAKPRVVADREVTVRLVDANGQDVGKKLFRTNAFGSISGEFTLPQATRSGVFRLLTDRGGASIRVEEYKRPSFELAVEPIEGEVFFNETLTLKGFAKTYSGVNLRGGKLAWTITRGPYWGRRAWGLDEGYDYRTRQVAAGTATVQADGTFTIPFTPEADPRVAQGRDEARYVYRLTATLTDERGETRTCEYAFEVGNRGISVAIASGSQMEKNEAYAIARLFALNQSEVKRAGTFSLRRLGNADERLALADSGRFAAGDTLGRATFPTLESGRYRLTVYADDARGNSCTSQWDFVLYGQDDRRPPIETHVWALREKMECAPGESAEFVFGTSDTAAYVLYELFDAEGARIDLRRMVLNAENRRFSIPFREEYGLGVKARLSFVKEGAFYQEQFGITRRQPDRHLTIHTETFRDRLAPGARERWKFRLTDADSLPVRAEVLAGMYDASLDQLSPGQWAFHPEVGIYLPWLSFRVGECFSKEYRSDRAELSQKALPEDTFDRLYDDWYRMLSSGLVIRGYARSNQVFATGSVMMKAAVPEAAADVFNMVEDQAAVLSEPTVVIAEEEVEAGGAVRPVAVRENFAETAFFFPVLVTDADGSFSFDFTMPESNTTWKLQLLAVTDSLRHGYLTREIVTSKPLMVQPNWPRFLREGDEVNVVAQLINQSDTLSAGRARLELFNPENGQPIICLTKSQKPFTLERGASTTLSWAFQVPAVADGVMGCRIVADAETASDGEQVLLPVLPDEVVVTESEPFYLGNEAEREVTLPEAGKGTTLRAVLEVTANPVWYAVQALPTLSEASEGDVLSWFAVYYSNVLANRIVGAHPRLKPVIQQWLAEAGSEENLLSSLEKNEELKAVLLAETPWVLDAANETDQKRRLGLLFQANRAEEMRRVAFQRLADQQLPSGGWGWFKGLYANRHMTLQILKGMAQLTELGAIQYDEGEKTLQMRALRYLDQSILKDYENLRRNEASLGRYVPSLDQVEYLYVRSFYRDIPEGEAREAVRYFSERAEASWKDQPLYGRAAIGRLAWRNGHKDKALEIARWFVKTASEDEEMGVYWKNNRRELGVGASPIETHCLAMALSREALPGELAVDGLKQWLLSQKRTQMWESVPATMNAIHTLLLDGSDWLSADNQCLIAWGDETYATDEGTTALGYRRVVREPGLTTAIPSSVTIRKEGAAPAWGAIYTQRLVPLREMAKTDGHLDVEKKLFVAENDGTTETLREVKPGEALHVGDEVVVRLTLRNDREMTFVVLKDLRAGCLEPGKPLSGAEFRDGLAYYRNPKDLSENFYFDRLPVGTFVLEYRAYVSRAGEYAGGFATLQCLYAPEFVSRTEGGVLLVE